MAKKQIVIISGHRHEESINYVTRLYLNSDEVSARRQFEDDGGTVISCQTMDNTDIIEWQSTLSGIHYSAVLP